MESLPDDVWRRILETGTNTGQLDHKDLCSLSMTCHHFDELAEDTVLWSILFDRDFNSSSDEFPSKALYKEEFAIGINWKDGLLCPWRSLFRWRLSQPSFTVINHEPLLLRPWPIYSRFDLFDATDDDDSVEEAIGQSSSSRSTHVPYVKDKFSKKLPKVPRPKVKPNSKSYIPMNRPPRRALARKI